jgi:hypothetical protein
MGNEAINTRANIDVVVWVRRKDFPRGPQVSMEVVPLGNTRAVRVLGHDRKRLTQEGSTQPALLRGHLAVSYELAKEAGTLRQPLPEPSYIKSEHAGEMIKRAQIVTAEGHYVNPWSPLDG